MPTVGAGSEEFLELIFCFHCGQVKFHRCYSRVEALKVKMGSFPERIFCTYILCTF